VMRRKCFVMTVVVTIGLLNTLPCFGQDLPANTGQRVFVKLTDSKRELHGRLLSLTAETLSIESRDGRIDVPMTQVLRVEKKVRDSLLNGAIFGMVYVAACMKWWCEQGGSGHDHPTTGDVLLGVTTGAAIGAWWDSMLERRVPIYNGPAQATRHSSGMALRFQLRF
jgi:hypothetical protein